MVPHNLKQRVLHLSHYPKVAGHPGGRKLYKTLSRHFYWPSQALDCYATVRNCTECARERVKLRKHTKKLKLFPATAPLESISIDLLGDLITTKRNNRWLLVITDRFSKLVRTVPLKNVTAITVAEAFTKHWIFVYGPPVSVLSDNGKQFTAKFFQDVCRIIGIKNVFTTTYHPQTNGQVERFNRTILAALRHYVGDHPKDWDLYSDALTYAYNTQAHGSIGVAPFELVLSRAPEAISIEVQPTLDTETATTTRLRWKARLAKLISTAKDELFKAQERYRRNFDARLRRSNETIRRGDKVFVKRDHTPRTQTRHKLAPVADGPFRVLDANEDTVVVDIDGEVERISRDRVALAPASQEVIDPIAGETNEEVDSDNEDSPIEEQTQEDIPQNENQNDAEEELDIPNAKTSQREETNRSGGIISESTAGSVEKPNMSNQTQQTYLHRKPQDDKSATTKLKSALRKKKRVSFSSPPSEEIQPGYQDSNSSNDTDKEKAPTVNGKATTNADEPPAEWFVIEKIVDHGEAEDGELLYRVQWYGFDAVRDSTWEPVRNIPRSHIVRYCHNKGIPYPANLEEALVG